MAAPVLAVKKVCFVLIVSFTLCLSQISETSHNRFSTKTQYRWAHPQTETNYKDDDLNTLPELNGMTCSAAHATVVARHGTRYPGFDDVQELIHLHEKLIEAMEPDANPDLYNWKSRFPSNNDKVLAHVGEDELESLGMRIGKRLSTLFADEELANFRFITSSMQRTKQSASAFFEGFINTILTEEEESEDFDSEVNDELMRFFDLCARYVYGVKDNKTAMNEYYSFMNNERVTQIRDKITAKLGVESELVTPGHVRLLYIMCGYEWALFEESPWCPLFDDADMIPLEYLGDLKHYYKNGHGFNITYLQSCPLVSEIFATMDEVILEIENSEDDEEIDGYLVGQFAFGHAETLGPLFSALGLFNDSLPLRADNFESHGDRAFRTSQILPFASNIMFVLYECVAEELAEEEEIDEAEYFVKVLVNEQAVVMPGCPDVYCNYNDLRKRYQHLVDDCKFKKMCKRNLPKDEL